MTDRNDLESLYQDAKAALAGKDYARASDLLKQVLQVDEDYKDVSRLLAQTVKRKRRRWYHHPLLWGSLGAAALVLSVAWFAPILRKIDPNQGGLPTGNLTSAPLTSETQVPFTPTPTPTAFPLVWKRISIGQEFPRDTITSIVADPKDADLLYLGMKNAGVFKSIDGGNSWYPVQNGLGNAQVLSLVVHPEDGNTLLAGTQGGVYLTQDGGETWKSVSEIAGKYLLIDPRNGSHLYLGDEKNIYESNDLGTSWTQNNDDASCPSKNQYNTLVLDPQDSNRLLATASGMNEGMGGCQGVYHSNDNGRTWTRLGLISARALAFVQEENNSLALLTYGDDSTRNGLPEAQRGGLIISRDEGKTWKWEQMYHCSILVTDHNNPSLAYCGVEEGGLFVINVNGGVLQSGLPEEIVTAIYADTYNGQQRIIAGVEKNGLFVSLDGGNTWEPKSGGIGAPYLGLMRETGNGTMIYANIQYSNTSCALFRSEDNGLQWKAILDIPAASDERRYSTCHPAVDADNNLYIIQHLAIMQSKNAGESWDFLPMPQLEDTINIERWVSANPILPGLLYFIPSNEPCLYYSVDSGQSWQGSKSASCHYDHSNATMFFGNQGQVVYREWQRSSNAGKNWQNCGDSNFRNHSSDSFLAINPKDNAYIVLATTGQGIKVSSDSCQSWQISNAGLGNLFVNTVVFAPNHPEIVYAGTDGGAYISYDAGLTWGQINDGLLGATVVYSIAVDKEGNVYAATPYGIFMLESR